MFKKLNNIIKFVVEKQFILFALRILNPCTTVRMLNKGKIVCL